MTVTIYRWSDTSAPTLNGTAGSLVRLLDACLVNGYGSQTGAGWTKPYGNVNNVGCYQNSSSAGTGFCLSVNDNGPGAAGFAEARMTGFQALTSLSTGTGQFPTASQLGIGTGAVVCRKSATADTTTRAWTLVADNTVFYFFAETGDSTFPFYSLPFLFGDFFSYKLNDPNRCMIIGRNIENSALTTAEGFSALHIGQGTAGFLNQTMIGHYCAGNFTGVGGSIGFGKHVDHGKMGAFGNNGNLSGTATLTNGSVVGIGANANTSNFVYPNGPDGGLYLSPIWIHHNNIVRGYFKGLWSPCHDRPLNHNDTFSGSNNLAGKSFLVQAIAGYINSAAYACQVHIESSSTWS